MNLKKQKRVKRKFRLTPEKRKQQTPAYATAILYLRPFAWEFWLAPCTFGTQRIWISPERYRHAVSPRGAPESVTPSAALTFSCIRLIAIFCFNAAIIARWPAKNKHFSIKNTHFCKKIHFSAICTKNIKCTDLFLKRKNRLFWEKPLTFPKKRV